MTEDVPRKKLRFAYPPSADESICGALAAACHEQRLRSISTALERGGISLARPGSIQVADERVLSSLAAVMHTEIETLKALVFSFAEQKSMITLGELHMPRVAFTWESRRIAPLTLRGRSHHRSAWLNLLLPYCPESLELLVDACPSCGPLGWRRTRGIPNCEHCGEIVPPSEEPGLKLELVNDYRAAARMMSRDHSAGAAAIEQLPKALQAFARTVLVEVLVRIGVACSRGQLVLSIKDLRKMPPAFVVEVLCTGMRMLRGWPASIQRHVDQQTEGMEDNVLAYQTLRTALRRAAGTTEEGREIMSMAFSRLDGRTSETFAGNARYYTASQVNTKLGTSSKELKLLRNAEALRFEKLPSNERLRARYDAGDVETLAGLLKNSTTPGSAGVTLDVPLYAVEQIAARGAIKIIDHPGVGALRGPQVALDSVERFLSNLCLKAARTPAPASYVSLKTALASCPGEKPWGQAIEALLAGTVPFHIEEEAPSLRRLLVDPARFPLFAPEVTSDLADRLNITHISLRDACETLVTNDRNGMAAIRSAGLKIERSGAGMGIGRQEFRDFLKEIVFVGESAAFTGRDGRELHHEFIRIGVPRNHYAWSRHALAKLGMINPSVPG